MPAIAVELDTDTSFLARHKEAKARLWGPLPSAPTPRPTFKYKPEPSYKKGFTYVGGEKVILLPRPPIKKLDHELIPVLVNQAETLKAKRPNMTVLKRIAANRFGTTSVAIESSRRHSHLTLCRHVVMYIAREVTLYSFPHIGRHLGGRDHTTAMHGANRIKRLLNAGDPEATKMVSDMMSVIDAVYPRAAA